MSRKCISLRPPLVTVDYSQDKLVKGLLLPAQRVSTSSNVYRPNLGDISTQLLQWVQLITRYPRCPLTHSRYFNSPESTPDFRDLYAASIVVNFFLEVLILGLLENEKKQNCRPTLRGDINSLIACQAKYMAAVEHPNKMNSDIRYPP